MKKSWLILLLVTVGVTSCSGQSSSKKKNGGQTSENTEMITSASSSSKTTSSTSGPVKAGVVEQGAEHSLPWDLDYDYFKDPSESLGYAAYHKTYTFDGTNVYAYGMRAVKEIAVNINGSLIQYKGFQIIHLCKKNHESWPDGGQLQFSAIKPTKLVLELVTHSKNSYHMDYPPTIYLGKDNRVEAPTLLTSFPSAVNEEFNVYDFEYSINASEATTLTLLNESKFSMYIQSIHFE